ncbi:hypothetical protein THAOC_09184, partial [Thalassiosira oceanica]
VGEGSGHGPGQPVKDCQEPSISTRAARDEASYPTCRAPNSRTELLGLARPPRAWAVCQEGREDQGTDQGL